MKQYKNHLLVIALYTVLTFIFTWPWVANFASAFPGSPTWAFDESTFIWNIWRFKHNVLDLGQSPLHTQDIFWPLGISLVLYTYNFLNVLLALPLLLGVNLPIASNITILLAYVFSGYGTYLLIRYLLHRRDSAPLNPPKRGTFKASPPKGEIFKASLPLGGIEGGQHRLIHLSAFIGGAIYAFAASKAIFAALGHYDIVTTQFIPFFTLFFIKTLQEPNLKNPILAGIFAALCLLAEMIFGVFLLFLGLILLATHLRADYSLFESKHQVIKRWLDIGLKMGLLALTAAILWGPVMIPILKAFTQDDFALTGWGESLKLSADLVGWFTPTDLHPLWGSDWVTRLRQVQAGTAPFSDVNTVFLGYGVLVLAVVGSVTYWTRVKEWFVAAGVFAVFTLGPLLQIKGQFLFPLDNLLKEQGIAQDITFPLPFALLHYLPIIKANRVPARFSVVLGLALAVLAAYGVFWLLRKMPAKQPWLVGATVLLMGVALFDQLAVPLPLSSAVVPDVYAQIGAESDDFSLLQLPLGWRNSFGVFGAERTQIQYYQHIHQKPMIGGNISRSPAFKFEYYKSIPFFQTIAQTELPASDPPVDPDTLAKATQQAGELMTLYNVKYVIFHAPIDNRKPYEDTVYATQDLLLTLLPLEQEPTYLSTGVIAYKVNQPPVADPLRIDLGDWPANAYRGEGWATNEFYQGASVNWAIAEDALLFFPYQGTGDRFLTMHLTPFSYSESPQQVMTLLLNDVVVGDYPLGPTWQVLETLLPAEHLKTGLNRLTLRFSHQAVPRQVLPPQTAIGNTGVFAPVDIEINSHADFSFITVGFEDEAVDASSHRRGFNLAVIDPISGEVLAMKGFDTAANQYEVEAMHEFIATIPQGQIVIVSSQGLEATAFLSEGFSNLGGVLEVPDVPYSLLGVKGAAPNTALAVSGEAYLRVGANPDIRPLAVAVDWVEIKSNE